MWDFERDSVGKGGVLFFLALNVLCLLWCVHWLLLLRGAAFLLGLLILLLWIAFVMADEAKALLYHRQMVFLRPEGVFVGSRKHSRKLAWEEIREAEVRFARNSGWNLFANDWLVLSKEPLSDSVRGAICSDVSPWLPEMGLAEFRFSALSWDPDIGNEEVVAFLKEKCPLLRDALALYDGRSLAWANADGAVLLPEKQYDKLTAGVSNYSTLMVFREIVWLGAAPITMGALSGARGLVSNPGVLLILWGLAVLIAVSCIIARRKILNGLK